MSQVTWVENFANPNSTYLKKDKKKKDTQPLFKKIGPNNSTRNRNWSNENQKTSLFFDYLTVLIFKTLHPTHQTMKNQLVTIITWTEQSILVLLIIYNNTKINPKQVSFCFTPPRKVMTIRSNPLLSFILVWVDHRWPLDQWTQPRTKEH